jgi:hypothetical protein
MSRSRSLLVVGALVVIAVVIAFVIPPIRQPAVYHRFADARAFLGIPNAQNVLSNQPFLLVGLLGLRAARAGKLPWTNVVLCLAVVLVGVGSAYYHLGPSDARLVWDRLPMAIVFMAVLAMVISRWISASAGTRLFVPLVLLGIGSVILWQRTGDLRAYLLVQFFPLLLVPLILVLFSGPRADRRALAMGTGLYIVAKLLELGDRPVFSLEQIVSGHTLKHVVAAIAIYQVTRAFNSNAA